MSQITTKSNKGDKTPIEIKMEDEAKFEDLPKSEKSNKIVKSITDNNTRFRIGHWSPQSPKIKAKIIEDGRKIK